ncbi:MAG: LysR family transcriptional regulator [Pseudochelatococcus sp.]|uniref:LysR family transcriptional regulator n=1 Tax=Pseudochelatococcus sp. TaxID=2020869 RepID=UPI003D94A9CE
MQAKMIPAQEHEVEQPRQNGHDILASRDFIMRMSWDDFRLVRAICTTGSLTGAADALGVNHSTVFRRLANLEALIGVKLFERHRSGYTPTPPAEEMLAISERWSDDVAALGRLLMGCSHSPSGELRITTSDTLLLHLLTPLFAGFRAEYPNIQLEILLANQPLNLSKRDADVAIRATDNPPETLVGRRLSAMAWAVYGRRADFDGSSPGEADLAQCNWLTMSDHFGAMKAVRYVHAAAASGRLVYRVNSVLGLAEAVEAGIGIGPLPCFIADTKPGLRRLTPPDPEFSTSLWLLTHPDLRRSVRVRAFLDYIAAEITRLRPFLEGESIAGQDDRGASAPSGFPGPSRLAGAQLVEDMASDDVHLL